jgi:hypothetical protein
MLGDLVVGGGPGGRRDREPLDARRSPQPLDNDRYPGMRWTTVRDVLAG